MPTAKRKHKVKFKKKTALKFIIFSVVIFIVIFFTQSQLKPVVTSMSSYYVRQYASSQLSSVVNQTISDDNLDYNDLVSLDKGNDGKIISIQTKAQKITQLHTSIIKQVNDELSKLENQTISIPIGSLSGIAFLSGRGPEVNIKIIPKGAAGSEISSSLQEAGINQTLHTINIKVSTQITSIIPLFSTTQQVDCDCLIAQSVIVGAVPNYYTRVISQNSDPTTDMSKYGNPRFSNNDYQ